LSVNVRQDSNFVPDEKDGCDQSTLTLSNTRDGEITQDAAGPIGSKNDDDKYGMGNLQLVEAFDDEYNALVVDAIGVSSVEVKDSKMDTIMDKRDRLPLNGKHGMISFFRGSRGFRLALFICCLLHLALN